MKRPERVILRGETRLFLSILLAIVLPVFAAANASAAPFAYVPHFWGDTVSVIDTSTNTVVETVSVGSNPYGVAVHPAGTRVYVTNSALDRSPNGNHTVSVIDTSTNTVVETVSVGSNPVGVAVNPAGTRLYVGNYGSTTVSVIDTSTNTVVATVSVGSNPIGVAVNPAGTRVYVANYGSKTVSVIDTSTNTVVATVNVGSKWANVPGWESWDRSSPFGVAVHPAGTRLYVTSKENDNGNWFSVIDTNTNQVVAAFDAGGGYGVAVHPAGTWVYVTTQGSATVSVIDTNTNQVVATPHAGLGTFGVAVNPAGTRLYVTNVTNDYNTGKVHVLDTSTYVTVAAFNVGLRPYSLGNFVGPDPTPADTTPPTTTNNAPSTWQKADFTVTLTCADNEGGSGCKETKYRVDGGAWQTGTSILISTEDNHFIDYYSVDNAGNQESANSTHAKLDKTPPSIMALRTPGPNANGWNNSDVTVSFACSDGLSGIDSCGPTPQVVSFEGAGQSRTGTAVDMAGNSASTTMSGINIDRTLPMVTYSGNAGTYTVDQSVAITCAAADALSGVASDTCANINGPAYTFTLGTNSFSASATDLAGNTGNGSTSFTVQVTAAGLGNLVMQFVTKAGVANSMISKLNAAAAAEARGNAQAKAGAIGAFINELQAQAGKALTAAQAAMLIALAQAL
ncbi:MAG TPA: hypothetical protein DCZ05_00875 [Deltaproteobacteria bacterium]|nr:hypothetical protein [Deltaproteobacteria bacterium]